jgi:hypothetical protein
VLLDLTLLEEGKGGSHVLARRDEDAAETDALEAREGRLATEDTGADRGQADGDDDAERAQDRRGRGVGFGVSGGDDGLEWVLVGVNESGRRQESRKVL